MGALTLALGVAVLDVVDAQLGDERARIKWPNDIYVDDRKLAGILVESTVKGNQPPVIIAGVGVNVLGRAFEGELAQTATSLALAGGRGLDRDVVAAQLIGRWRAAFDAFVRNGLADVLTTLRERDYLVRKRVRVDAIEGVAGGIDNEGCLIVGGMPVASGSVQLLE